MKFKLISNFKFQTSNSDKGFTLVELIIVIAIIAILSGVILFAVTQYISKGKDANLQSNLALLVPAGETYYNIKSNSYDGFCDPAASLGVNVIANVISQIPQGDSAAPCYDSGTQRAICCNVESSNHDAWAACAQEFNDKTRAYCVDSRGMKEDMSNTCCNGTITQCPDFSTTAGAACK